jgi:hypothetical protein
MPQISLKKIKAQCQELKTAYEKGLLGNIQMPEETHPEFASMTKENLLSYYTMPMALNYQRNSYKLWESAKKTYEDKEINWVFDISKAQKKSAEKLRLALLKYKLALQPNKHIQTWHKISTSFYNNYETIEKFFTIHDADYLKIKNTVQITHKKDYPYLSGPKIFNYWCHIIQRYGGIRMQNSNFIEIAPDTHVIQASIKLGIFSLEDAEKLKKDEINNIWREFLSGTGIDPIDMHSPLWFWSRSGFKYELE